MRRCRVSSPLLLYQVNLFKFVALAVEPDGRAHLVHYFHTDKEEAIGPGNAPLAYAWLAAIAKNRLRKPLHLQSRQRFRGNRPFSLPRRQQNRPQMLFSCNRGQWKEGGENFKDF